MTIEKLKEIAKIKGYNIFENDSKDYNLNIWAFRNNASNNKFDDIAYVFWKYNGVWVIRQYKITTDPGRYYLRNFANPHGSGALVEGQYNKAWQIGLHNGKYEALVQVEKLPFYRDTDKDDILELDPKTIENGYWGCNIHHAYKVGETLNVDNYSAGCQVFARIMEYNEFMELCKHARDNWGNKFTYTLINYETIREIFRTGN